MPDDERDDTVDPTDEVSKMIRRLGHFPTQDEVVGEIAGLMRRVIQLEAIVKSQAETIESQGRTIGELNGRTLGSMRIG